MTPTQKLIEAAEAHIAEAGNALTEAQYAQGGTTPETIKVRVALAEAAAALQGLREAQAEPVARGPIDDFGRPIVYDTEAVDAVTHALTGDEGEDDSVTVLKRLARYVENVWPGKTAQQVLMEYEERLLATPPTTDAPAQAASGGEVVALTVRVCSFPESNGKRNWTAMLVRKRPWGGLIGNCGGITIAHGELWNRVAYEAECARALLGERDTEPHILDYGDDIHTPEEWGGEIRGGKKVLATPAGAPLAASVGEKVAFSARPLVWEAHESGEQWTDKHHGFCVVLEPESDEPYSASWGEGDSEDFATLEAAQAWCQRELDAWVRRHVVATPASAPPAGEPTVPVPTVVSWSGGPAPYRFVRLRLDDTPTEYEYVPAGGPPAPAAAREVVEALREALAALNAHEQWHIEYDDFGGYPDSALDNQTHQAKAKIDAALAAADAQRAQEGGE